MFGVKTSRSSNDKPKQHLLADIASGFSEDCNTNGVPDSCDLLSGASEVPAVDTDASGAATVKGIGAGFAAFYAVGTRGLANTVAAYQRALRK